MKEQTYCSQRLVVLILALVGLMGAATLILGPARRASAQAAAASWSYTGNLNTARRSHTATLLPNGKVLVAGGFDPNNCCTVLNSAELYDPCTGRWSSTGNLNTARMSHTTTLLPNGKVLVAGVWYFGSTELYDPATGTWSITGNLNIAREGPTATLLPNGKVLIAGGYDASYPQNPLNSAELYDPANGTWSLTGNLNTARAYHTATLLPNGKVLVAAGAGASVSFDSAELYDPATGIWSYTGSLNQANGGSATLLPNGKVLVAGAAAELYDPFTGTWNYSDNLQYPRSAPSTLLGDGRVLVAGGGDTHGDAISSTELYDPATGTWSIAAYLNVVRWAHTATLLPNGKILVAGGTDSDVNSAELYDPSSSPNIKLIDDARFLAHQHYIDFLDRDPDAEGLAFWINEITSCGGDAQCIEVKRINVSASFFLSIEFQKTGFFVYRVHKAAHGNLPGLPVPIKLNEFLSDTSQVARGVIVGQPGWEQVLESNKQSFLCDIDGTCGGFTSAYPASMRPSEFVDTLFANAEVTPSATDRTLAINEFFSATTTIDEVSRARALRRVAENSTLARQEFNCAFVLMQYFGYLRRNPNDAPEATLDFQGYNFWLTKLNSFNGSFIDAEMVKAFLSSIEYRQRFGQP